MNSSSMPDQMLALPAFIGWVLLKNWRPLLADVTVLVVAVLLVAGAGWLITTLETWIGNHVSAYWQRHRAEQASEQMWHEFDSHAADQFPADVHDGHTQIMPGVTYLGPTVPMSAHKLQRRRVAGVRIPGRRMRRHHPSTSNSDRRS